MYKGYRIKDLILGTMMIGLSLFILFNDSVIKGNSIFKENILIARSDFYLKFLAIILMAVSFAVLIKAFIVTKEDKDHKSDVKGINYVVILSFIGLVVYALIIKQIGFFISSFLLVTFLSFIIMVKEKSLDIRDKTIFFKGLLTSIIVSLVSVTVVTYIFTKWLKVVLP